MKRSIQDEDDPIYPSKKIPRTRDSPITEEYLISVQPYELLLKQLSDPNVTLQDVENLCATNRKIRTLCKTDPQFIKLREGKKVYVEIIRDPLDEDGSAFYVYIYNYQGSNIVVNGFEFPLYPENNISDILVELNKKKYAELGDLKFDLNPINPGRVKIPQIVSIGQPDKRYHNHEANRLFISYKMFESIMLEIKRLAEGEAYGTLNILVNGDIVYKSLWLSVFDPTLGEYITQDIL